MNKSSSSQNSINLLIDDTQTEDPAIIVEKFNTFFVNIGPNLASKIPNSTKSFTDFLLPSNLNSMAVHLTDKPEIAQVIKSLKNNAS